MNVVAYFVLYTRVWTILYNAVSTKHKCICTTQLQNWLACNLRPYSLHVLEWVMLLQVWKSYTQQHGHRLAFDPWWLPFLPSFLKSMALLYNSVSIKNYDTLLLKLRNRSREYFVVSRKTTHLGLLNSSNPSPQPNCLLKSLDCWNLWGPFQTLAPLNPIEDGCAHAN
jgi:hypothetical protein